MLAKQSKTILLRAEDAIVPEDDYTYNNVTFNVSSNLITSDNRIAYRTIQLSYVTIPGSFYIVNIDINDLVSIDIEGNTVQYALPEGSYDAYTLVSYLQTAFPDLEFVLNTATGKLAITSEKQFSILASTTAYTLLGIKPFITTPSVSISDNYVLECPFPCDLGGIRAIIFNSSFITTLNSIPGALKSYLFSVPISNVNSVSSGTITSFCPSAPPEITLYLNTIQVIDIQVTDQEGVPVNFRGVPWLLEMVLSEYYFLTAPVPPVPPTPPPASPTAMNTEDQTPDQPLEPESNPPTFLPQLK